MKIIKFNCNEHNAPAYSCSEPGDNSGEYLKIEEIDKLRNSIHSKIMNIQADDIKFETTLLNCHRMYRAGYSFYQIISQAYREGQRDVRHEVGELVIKEMV